MYHALPTLYQQKHTKIEMLPWDFKLFIGIFVGIMVMGFIIIPIIKHFCCVWPRYKNGIGCAKKPCCVYFHFWDNEGEVQVFWKRPQKFLQVGNLSVLNSFKALFYHFEKKILLKFRTKAIYVAYFLDWFVVSDYLN